jgi:hypothetical protein
MERALANCGASYQIIGPKLPDRGLAMIQWTGPWTQPNVPPRVACMYRHWIAVQDGLIWDANIEDWVTPEVWELFLPQLIPDKADGWRVARGYEVRKQAQ